MWYLKVSHIHARAKQHPVSGRTAGGREAVSKVKGLTLTDGGQSAAHSLLRTQRFPTCLKGWHVKQGLFVPLVLCGPFPLLPSQLAARARPTPHKLSSQWQGASASWTRPPQTRLPKLQNLRVLVSLYQEMSNFLLVLGVLKGSFPAL